MNAREQILADIGRALASADRTPPPIPRDYRERDTAADTVDLFVERVEDYRATVRRCPETEVRQAIAAAVGSHTAIVPPDFPWAVDGSTVDIGQSAAELDRIDCIVTTARLGIASTGTIVLDHGPGQGRRALSLVPDTHICVLHASQIVAGVPEAIAALDPARPQTWISGPSATSDIELIRVEGVHGPRTLQVLLIG